MLQSRIFRPVLRHGFLATEAMARRKLIAKRLMTRLTPAPSQSQTIFALATPPGRAGIAIIRISGPAALNVWRLVIRPQGSIVPWTMQKCRIINPKTQQVIDHGLAVFFKAPRSFTTEDVVELHVHSGRAIIKSLLSTLSQIDGCRLAERGEFTRRAFENGRLDLTQVEGLRDLVDAETEEQRKLALRAVGGAMKEKYEKLRSEIIGCLAPIEALIDFGEGEDIEEGIFERVRERVLRLREAINVRLSDNRRGELMRSGIRMAIFGPPNAGKSSLLNYLVQREAAIVTDLPGTTRDVMDLSLDLGGMPVVISDTAGLRETEDVVERIGIHRALRAIRAADVGVYVLPLSDFQGGVEELASSETLFVLNKTDLVPDYSKVVSCLPAGASWWAVSIRNGDGMGGFVKGLEATLRERFEVNGDIMITHERHRVHLQRSCEFLDGFLRADDVILAAEDLRYAAQEIGKVCGTIDTEHILDAVFREFCIGK